MPAEANVPPTTPLIAGARTSLSGGGALLRLCLLEQVGITLPADLGAAAVAPLDDLLDAAAAAWSAHRIARGTAQILPAAFSDASPSGGATWY